MIAIRYVDVLGIGKIVLCRNVRLVSHILEHFQRGNMEHQYMPLKHRSGDKYLYHMIPRLRLLCALVAEYDLDGSEKNLKFKSNGTVFYVLNVVRYLLLGA